MRWIRTGLFYGLWFFVIIFWALFILLMYLVPYRVRHYVATYWADSTIRLLRVICGVDWYVTGLEHLPTAPAIIAVNHQSTWETVFTPTLLRRQLWVVKKELVRIPVFGWAMAALRPIAIDRSQKKAAMIQVIEQGKEKIEQGYSLVMFPEGHRFPPDAPLQFRLGAARLAKGLNVPIVPIAHNAGQFWPRRGLIHEGTVQVCIGAAFLPENYQTPETLNAALEDWVRQKRDDFVQAEKIRRGENGA